ncbi:MAG: hypothetical protein K5648_04190 [Erysipelotrichaceae bacterium]|nr:hypothetical protein [Erysipelotrichaceae bacterium]
MKTKHLWNMILILLICLSAASCSVQKEEALPLPELEEGVRGQLGIDKNINEASIDKYLGRSDSIYRDMRMLKDEADYEAIGGDSYLSGYVKGFEVVPYPYLCNVTGLPEEVGASYSGDTLFTKKEDGTYEANYEESLHILESIFPKDKYIFLMCGGGGYAGMTKELLVSQGYDADKIYNTGGYWYYDGENKTETFYEEDGVKHYDFSNIPYHPILFDALTPMEGYEGREDGQEKESTPSDASFIEIHDADELRKLEEEGKTFLLYVYLPGCSSCVSFKPIVKEFQEANDIGIYAVDLSAIFKESNSVSDRVSFSPSFFIYIDGEVAAYLDPGSDEDLPYYQTLEGLSSFVSKYLDVEIIKSDTVNEVSDCESACSLTD